MKFLRAAERLKVVTRIGRTSAGEPGCRRAHVAALPHGLVLQRAFRNVRLERLLNICIVHNLGETVSQDVPAPEQARRSSRKAADKRRDLLKLLVPLSPMLRTEIPVLIDVESERCAREAEGSQAR